MLTEDDRRRIHAEIKAARVVPTGPSPEPGPSRPPGRPEALIRDMLLVTFRPGARLRSALEAYFQGVPGIRVIEDRRAAERRGPNRWRWHERRRGQRRRPLASRGFVGVVRWPED